MIPLKDDQPRYSTPVINYFLIVINLLIFFFEASLRPRELGALVAQLGVVPSHVTAFLGGSPSYSLPQVALPFLTSIFLHGSWMHVIGNMWFLYIFGDNIEDYLGHFPYLLFYLTSGVLAMMTQVLFDPTNHIPALGASGAIAGVMGAYLILFPRARVLIWVFIFFFYVPAWLMLGYWFIVQFFSGAATALVYEGRSAGGGVAFWAHVGGFVFGALTIRFLPRRRRRSPYGS